MWKQKEPPPYGKEELQSLIKNLGNELAKHHPCAGMEAISILVAYYFLDIANDRNDAIRRIHAFADITAKYAKYAPEKYLGLAEIEDADQEDIRVS